VGVSPRALTAVLPVRIDAQKATSDLDRVERLLLPSFERFWRGPDRLERQLQNQLYRPGRALYEVAWRPEHVASLAQRWGDDDGEAFFFVLQSTLEIPIQEVEDLMRRSPTGMSPSRKTA
jgi:hypothetical protein